MWRPVRERLSSWEEIFWGKALLIGTTLWVILGAWDLIKSELLPDKYQSWTLVAKTPHLSWRAWVIALLTILLGVLLEGAHAAIQTRAKANVELQTKMMEQAIATRGKTTMNRDWPGDWKLAEDGFRRHEKSSVRADLYHNSLGQTEVWTLGGDTLDAIQDCRALCLQAGKLLVVSPMSSHLAVDLRSHQDDADRWLYFLKERYGLTDVINSTSMSGGQSHASTLGSIRNLAAASARACIECGAKSFPS
jgi:hypothetical protein